MGEDKLKRHHEEDCEEDECVAVKGCRKGRPVKVRLEEDCDPIPVKLEQKHCDPLLVKIKQEHCEPLKVHGTVHVKQREEDCWRVQACPDGLPFHVIVDNPAAGSTNNQVFNGATWEPLLTPSRFVALDNMQINGSATVWTPAPGTRFRLMGYFLTSSLAGQVNFRDGIGGPVIASQVVAAGQPFSPPLLCNGIKSANIGNPLVLEIFAGPGTFANVTGLITGQDTP